MAFAVADGEGGEGDLLACVPDVALALHPIQDFVAQGDLPAGEEAAAQLVFSHAGLQGVGLVVLLQNAG